MFLGQSLRVLVNFIDGDVIKAHFVLASFVIKPANDITVLTFDCMRIAEAVMPGLGSGMYLLAHSTRRGADVSGRPLPRLGAPLGTELLAGFCRA